ncbi:MAG: FG-GAP repeat domain-containing protein [Planctomycetota bacterium]
MPPIRIFLETVSIAILLFVTSAPALGQSFPLRRYETGDYPISMTKGDFNNDSKADLAIANYSSNSVSILLADGAGSFLAATNISITSAGRPTAIAAADFNNDGNLDLAVTETGTPYGGSDLIIVLLGDGAGGFGTPQGFGVGPLPQGIAVADLNNNGAVDAVTANESHSLSVCFGDGLGSLGAPINMNVGASPKGVALTDFDANATIDILVTDRFAYWVHVFLGNGAGAFSATIPTFVGSAPIAVAIGDITTDGAVDAMVANFGSSNASLLVGTGTGTFLNAQNFSTGPYPAALAIEQLNGDSALDVAVGYGAGFYFSGGVSVLLGNGKGSFGAQSVYIAGGMPRSVVVANFTGDSSLDIATTHGDSNNVCVLPGNGDGTFVSPPSFPLGFIPDGLTLADFDHDGVPDAATADQWNQAVAVSFGNGTGSFHSTMNFSTGSSFPSSLAAADLDLDHKVDIVTSGVSVFLGDGVGGFSGPTQYDSNDNSIAVGDLNSDGFEDLVVSSWGTQSLDVLLATAPAVFGTPHHYSTISGSLPASPLSVAIADLNEDGSLEIVTGNQGSASLGNGDSILVFVNGGSGLFTTGSQELLSNYSLPVGLALAELNADGHIDAAVALNRLSGGLLTYSGTGTSVLGALKVYTSLQSNCLSIGDLNHDGLTDLVALSGSGNSFSIFINNNNSGFLPAMIFGCGARPESSALSDLDGDGNLDFVAACYNSKDLCAILNDEIFPLGLSYYGTGTSGCAGVLGISANSTPKVNTPNFAFTTTNSPHNSRGFCIVTDVQDAAGTDLLNIQLLFHVGVSSATELLLFDMISNASENGYAPAPIPNNPLLSGLSFYAQALLTEKWGYACSEADVPVVSSRGLWLTIRP